MQIWDQEAPAWQGVEITNFLLTESIIALGAREQHLWGEQETIHLDG